METGALGKVYQPGEVIVRQGEAGDCMYVIQEGQVAVMVEQNGHETPLAVLGAGEFFGEMAIFERQARSATVSALGEARVLTVDKRNLLRQITEDPTLAFHLVEHMSARIRALTNEIAWQASDTETRRAAETRLHPQPGRGHRVLEEAFQVGRRSPGSHSLHKCSDRIS